MKLLDSSRWINKVSAIATMSVVALSISTSAMAVSPITRLAQATTTDQSFLSDLYSFLQSEDPLTYQIARQEDPASIIHLASNVCFYVARDGNIQYLYDGFVLGVETHLQGIDQQTYEAIMYSSGLYFGTVANLGSAYYCPEHNTKVLDFLSTI